MYSLFRRFALTASTLIIMLCCASVLYCQTETVKSSTPGVFEVRGGFGTDIQLGLGIGVGGAYLWKPSGEGTVFEFGADFYYHHSTESYTDQRGNVTVKGEDKTTLTVFGVRANTLFNYHPTERSIYFIAGFGFVVASLDWEENENAPNWTAPTHDEVDGSSAGNIINLGIGVPIGTNLDLRIETPMLFFYSTPGKSASFAPTVTIGVTYRFE